MDIKLEKKPWYIRYRYYLAGGIVFLAFLVYVIILSAGPRKLRIDPESLQMAEVKNDKFMEYVDVEGLVQPILTIKVNAREAGSVSRIETGRHHPCTGEPRPASHHRRPARRVGETAHHLPRERD